MAVKCVVIVSNITEHANHWKRNSSFKGNAKTIQLSGLAASSPLVPDELKDEVSKFYDASPSIDFKLSTINPEAASEFDVEGIYEVTFRKVGQLVTPDN